MTVCRNGLALHGGRDIQLGESRLLLNAALCRDRSNAGIDGRGRDIRDR